MMDRIVLHCDCNSYYASVEELLRPELKNVPMAVAGDPKNRHGVIVAKNLLAKKFGIQTGDNVYTARQKCRDLVLVHPQLASSRGISVGLYQTLFTVAIAVVVTLSISSVGLLILNSLMVLPSAASRNVARDLRQYHGFSVLFSLAAGIGGLCVSYHLGCSAGAAISLILALIFAVTFCMRKARA